MINDKETPASRTSCTNEKGGSKMALLAVPQKQAFCIDAKDEGMLHTPSNAVLEALCKIRDAEASSKDTERLLQLDQQIRKLREKRNRYCQ